MTASTYLDAFDLHGQCVGLEVELDYHSREGVGIEIDALRVLRVDTEDGSPSTLDVATRCLDARLGTEPGLLRTLLNACESDLYAPAWAERCGQVFPEEE